MATKVKSISDIIGVKKPQPVMSKMSDEQKLALLKSAAGKIQPAKKAPAAAQPVLDPSLGQVVNLGKSGHQEDTKAVMFDPATADMEQTFRNKITQSIFQGLNEGFPKAPVLDEGQDQATRAQIGILKKVGQAQPRELGNMEEVLTKLRSAVKNREQNPILGWDLSGLKDLATNVSGMKFSPSKNKSNEEVLADYNKAAQDLVGEKSAQEAQQLSAESQAADLIPAINKIGNTNKANAYENEMKKAEEKRKFQTNQYEESGKNTRANQVIKDIKNYYNVQQEVVKPKTETGVAQRASNKAVATTAGKLGTLANEQGAIETVKGIMQSNPGLASKTTFLKGHAHSFPALDIASDVTGLGKMNPEENNLYQSVMGLIGSDLHEFAGSAQSRQEMRTFMKRVGGGGIPSEEELRIYLRNSEEAIKNKAAAENAKLTDPEKQQLQQQVSREGATGLNKIVGNQVETPEQMRQRLIKKFGVK